MARREYYLSPQCAHDGCGERAHYVFATRREQDETRRDLEKRPWRCIRHSQPDAVLSAETPSRETVLESYETDFGYGRSVHRFWASVGATEGGNGFAYGPGFKAFAQDFPAGTRLVVTARVELPAEALGDSA